LNRTNKIPLEKLIGTVVTERIIDVVFLLVILLANFLLEIDRLGGFIKEVYQAKMNTSSGGMFNTNMLIIALVIMISVISISVFVFQKLKNTEIGKKIIGIIVGLWEGMKSVWEMKNKWLFIFYSITIWMCYYLMVYICFFALDFTSHLGPVAAITVLMLGSFGFIAPVQGGIGAYHAAVMQALLLYGIKREDGLTFAFVAHTFQTLAVLLVGGICAFCIPFLIPKVESTLEPELVDESQKHKS
jgi:uncharacterized membrane protein YbhN (UPF0104 family)